MIREKVYSKDSYQTRKRYFRDRFEVLNEDDQPFQNGKTLLQKFVTFFDLGPKTYFGGRVLIAESSVTTEGKEKSASGRDEINPAQLSVVADSADVEVLIFDKSEIAFFPEDVQREIVIGLRKSLNMERPYTPAEMDAVRKKFTHWDARKQNVLVKALKRQVPAPMQNEVLSFTDNDKVKLIKLAQDNLL